MVETGAKDLSDFICYFLNSEKVETWHGIIIYHNMCAKVERITAKHKVSPAYSPAVAHECKHINAPSDVCRESE